MKGSRRKDSKGRVLQNGESQRKDGSYMFRYTNANQVRKSIYANDLNALRNKEQEIKRNLQDGIDMDAAKMTVSELVAKYMQLRSGSLKHNTLRAYGTAIRKIESSGFGKRPIGTIKRSDAQLFIKTMNDTGLKRNTLAGIKTVLQPAFNLAVEDDILRKNPFNFNLNELLPDDEKKRTAIPKEEQIQYLNFIRDNSQGTWFYEITILIETGLRVSELYGLTFADVDFQNKKISVNKQLCRTADRPYFIESPKSKSGNREIPMSDKTYFALQKAISERIKPSDEPIIDGVSGFIFLDVNNMPKVGGHLDNFICRMRPKYVAQYGENVTFISPHVLRHTFCTNMNEAGMNPKHLQYLMGHSRIEETFDTYTHADDYEAIKTSFKNAVG